MGAVPIKLSAISIAEFPLAAGSGIKFKLDKLFQQKLTCIEREGSSSTKLSQMFLHSKENSFLVDILRFGHSFKTLRKNHPELLTEALQRSPENLAGAASEWRAFVDEFYGNQGIPVSDYPQYVEIQEALGMYG